MTSITLIAREIKRKWKKRSWCILYLKVFGIHGLYTKFWNKK